MDLEKIKKEEDKRARLNQEFEDALMYLGQVSKTLREVRSKYITKYVDTQYKYMKELKNEFARIFKEKDFEVVIENTNIVATYGTKKFELYEQDEPIVYLYGFIEKTGIVVECELKFTNYRIEKEVQSFVEVKSSSEVLNLESDDDLSYLVNISPSTYKEKLKGCNTKELGEISEKIKQRMQQIRAKLYNDTECTCKYIVKQLNIESNNFEEILQKL